MVVLLVAVWLKIYNQIFLFVPTQAKCKYMALRLVLLLNRHISGLYPRERGTINVHKLRFSKPREP